jgi:phospholipid-binding lipoprotein MlaA
MNHAIFQTVGKSALRSMALGCSMVTLFTTDVRADNNGVPNSPSSKAEATTADQKVVISSVVSISKSAHPTPTPKPQVVVAKAASKATASKTTSPSGQGGAASDDPGDDYGSVRTISDPIQPVNRGTFWFNHQVYHYVFHPLNKVYKTVLPPPVRTGISNVFDNVNYPVRFVNDLLQWQPRRAGLETEKFVVNTTAGVGGIFKVSKKIPSLANVPKTDTTATLAKWRIPEGPYIVWPILGPKSARDTVGFVGDVALNPVTWLTFGAGAGISGGAAVAVQAPSTTSTTSDKLDNYETVTDHAVDRYEAVRSAYSQNRKKVESQ